MADPYYGSGGEGNPDEEEGGPDESSGEDEETRSWRDRNYPGREVKNPERVNQLFQHYGFSFANPEHITRELHKMFSRYKPVWNSGDDVTAGQIAEQTGCLDLYAIICSISGNPNHNHRVDAINILEEFDRRQDGMQWNNVFSTPVRPEPETTEQERQEVIERGDPTWEELDAIWNSGGFWQPVRRTGGGPGQRRPNTQGLPLPEINPTSFAGTGGVIPIGNDELIQRFASRANNDSLLVTAGVTGLMSIGQISTQPRLDTKKLLWDEPSETALPMPEDCRFLINDTPHTDPTLNDRNRWPDLEIWDFRIGGRDCPLARISRDSYIYHICRLAREMAAHPDIAKRYVIVLRAPPGSYGQNSNDELVNEAPPTAQEIELVIRWMTQAFPEIHITRNLEDNVYGMCPRSVVSNYILLNSKLFDSIENGMRTMEVSHLLLMVFQTIIHELGHWLFGKIWLRQDDPGPEGRAEGAANIIWTQPSAQFAHWALEQPTWRGRRGYTPRKMRFQIRPHQNREDENHPDHRWADWERWRGEMGQMIEWLVFGYMIDLPRGDMSGISRYLIVLCRGSWLEMRPDLQLKFTTYASGRLLQTRPENHRHRDTVGIREFIDLMEIEERTFREAVAAGHITEEISLSACLGTLIEFIVDADESNAMREIGGNDAYRKAVQWVCRDRQRIKDRNDGLQDEGCGTRDHGVPNPPARPLGRPGIGPRLLTPSTLIALIAAYLFLSIGMKYRGFFVSSGVVFSRSDYLIVPITGMLSLIGIYERRMVDCISRFTRLHFTRGIHENGVVPSPPVL